MKNYFKILTVTSFTIFFICGSHVYGQDLTQLLDAVDKIEAKLQNLIRAESAARQADFTNLTKKLDALQKQVASSDGKSGSQVDLSPLTKDIEFLKAEISRLVIAVESNQSSHGQGMSNESKQQIDLLAEKLASISKSLEGLHSEKKHVEKPAHDKPAYDKHVEEKAIKTTVGGKLYAHASFEDSDGHESSNEFMVSRTYVTIKSKLSHGLSSKITTDIKSHDNIFHIFLKYAFFDWKPHFAHDIASLRLGLQPTQYIDNMNKFWGRRYVAKTVGDEHHFITTSDFGLSIISGFGKKSKFGFASVAILNGTSYSDVKELNKQKDFNLTVLVNPLATIPTFKKSVLIAQVYSGTQNEVIGHDYIVDTLTNDTTFGEASDWKHNVVSVGGLFAHGYYYNVGFDLNFTTVGEGIDHHEEKKSGLSFFGTFYLKEFIKAHNFWHSLNFFGRLDKYDHNTEHDDDTETMIIFGIESKPAKGFYMALNFRKISFDDDSASENMIFFNTQLKF